MPSTRLQRRHHRDRTAAARSALPACRIPPPAPPARRAPRGLSRFDLDAGRAREAVESPRFASGGSRSATNRSNCSMTSPGSWLGTNRNETFADASDGDHGLAAGPGIAAPDAVDIRGRSRPQPLQRRIAALACGTFEARFAEECLFVEAERVPLRALRVGDRLHARRRSRATGCGRSRPAVRPRMRVSALIGFSAEPPYMPGMQVAVGGLQRHLRVGHAAQPRADRRAYRCPTCRCR